MCSIDVIVPVYNAEQYLDRCLKSLIDQSYKNFNVFLINDGSTDSSELICKKYVNSYENINMVSTANRGVSEARNVGLSLASSKYIVFVDSDDYLDSHYLLNLFNSIKSRTQLAICGYSYVDVDGRILKNSELENFSNKQELIVDILVNSKGARSALWNKIFILDIIKNNKLLFNSHLKIGEDLLFLGQYINEINDFSVTSEILYYYRVNPFGAMKNIVNSKGSIIKYFDEWESLDLFEKTLKKDLDNDNKIYNAIFYKRIIIVNKLLKFSSNKKINDSLIGFVADNFWKIIKSKEISVKTKIAVFFRVVKRSI